MRLHGSLVIAVAAGAPQKIVIDFFAEDLGIDSDSVIRELKRFRGNKKGGEKES